jgi:VIT1/CCC1 family predicted Fe2+/Mn2+ transporter
MRHSFQVGFSFGITSGIITTLGLMVGLSSGTHLKIAVIGGILTIAIADSLSDSMGIHISEESENRHSNKEIWESTLSTFFCKFIIALSFVIPVLFLNLDLAIWVCIIWGFSLLSIFSYQIAKKSNKKVWNVVIEHIIIGVVVIILAHFVGILISTIYF